MTTKHSGRKTTGSYYTPSCLVELALDEALEPLLDKAVARDTQEGREKALLATTVCEPACGGGAFLVGAAHRIADRLVTVRHPGEAASHVQRIKALWDVIAATSHGVDLNPIAVELSKIALRLECLHPAMASPFLDHHLKCGNGILGTTSALFDANIPDAAFKALAGDDSGRVTQLRALNKREREADPGGGLLSRFGPASRLGQRAEENYFAPDGVQLLDPEALKRAVAREIAAVTEDSMRALMAERAEIHARVRRVRALQGERRDADPAKLTEIDAEMARLNKVIDADPVRHFDVMMYTDRPGAATAREHLARALAHLAHVPGGVTFAGLHWAHIPVWRQDDAVTAETVAAARAAADRHNILQQHPGLAARKFAFDTWCAAFVQRYPPRPGAAAITHQTLCDAVEHPDSVPGDVRSAVDALAREYRFFHWELEFPNVFNVVIPASQGPNIAEAA